MLYKRIGDSDVKISIIGMGGHEYLSSGKSRGFNEDFELATKPGYIFDGFGDERRKKIISLAFEHGINFFDVTQDSEKEAIGRNLKEIIPPYEVYIQTRPEGMVYTYDKNNQKMADYDLLKAEVHRSLKLLRRECIDFFNFAFMESALCHDPDYLTKIKYNIKQLKKEGLIRFACADTFSGEFTYLEQIKADCFDVVYINFNFADYRPLKKVFPLAREKNMAIITREAFMKGELFKMAEEIGIKDKGRLAKAALKWSLAHAGVTSVILGTNNPDHFVDNLKIIDDMELNDAEIQLIEEVKKTEIYKKYEAKKNKEFMN